MCRLLKGIVPVFSIVLFIQACAPAGRLNHLAKDVKTLRYIGGYEIPFNFKFEQTVVGGLSGIDYDAANDLYYIISDDRSDRNPARFYSAKMKISANSIDSFYFTGVESLLQADGKIFPDKNQDKQKTPDPESIRYNANSRDLIWSSEGERNIKDSLLVQPAIYMMDTKGRFLDSFILPEQLKIQAVQKGPRQNGVLEGLSFANRYKTMFVNTEEPLYEDGPRADTVDNNAYIRIFKFDVASKKCIAQFGYKLEPVAYPPDPADGFVVNGVPEILALTQSRLLVLERSFSTGRLPCTIRLFIADLEYASDISLINLAENNSFIPAKKTLLLNLDELGIYTDNVEGMCFGPRLPNGNKTLILVSDNNFSSAEITQLLLFEIKE